MLCTPYGSSLYRRCRVPELCATTHCAEYVCRGSYNDFVLPVLPLLSKEVQALYITHMLCSVRSMYYGSGLYRGEALQSA